MPNASGRQRIIGGRASPLEDAGVLSRGERKSSCSGQGREILRIF
jgi:hypothetical protein